MIMNKKSIENGEKKKDVILKLKSIQENPIIRKKILEIYQIDPDHKLILN